MRPAEIEHLLSFAARAQDSNFVLTRDGRTIVLEPHAANILRVTLAGPSQRRPHPLDTDLWVPSMTGWSHEQNTDGNDIGLELTDKPKDRSLKAQPPKARHYESIISHRSGSWALVHRSSVMLSAILNHVPSARYSLSAARSHVVSRARNKAPSESRSFSPLSVAR